MQQQSADELVAKFDVGDEVNVKYNGRWYKPSGSGFARFHISHTWWTTKNGRRYNVRENGDEFREEEIRLAQ